MVYDQAIVQNGQDACPVDLSELIIGETRSPQMVEYPELWKPSNFIFAQEATLKPSEVWMKDLAA